MHNRAFRVSDLVVVGRATSLADQPREVGDFAVLNSGGPIGLIVDLGDLLTVAYQDGESVKEYSVPPECLRVFRITPPAANTLSKPG